MLTMLAVKIEFPANQPPCFIRAPGEVAEKDDKDLKDTKARKNNKNF
jgi:hypothetical protein